MAGTSPGRRPGQPPPWNRSAPANTAVGTSRVVGQLSRGSRRASDRPSGRSGPQPPAPGADRGRRSSAHPRGGHRLRRRRSPPSPSGAPEHLRNDAPPRLDVGRLRPGGRWERRRPDAPAGSQLKRKAAARGGQVLDHLLDLRQRRPPAPSLAQYRVGNAVSRPLAEAIHIEPQGQPCLGGVLGPVGGDEPQRNEPLGNRGRLSRRQRLLNQPPRLVQVRTIGRDQHRLGSAAQRGVALNPLRNPQSRDLAPQRPKGLRGVRQ